MQVIFLKQQKSFKNHLWHLFSPKKDNFWWFSATKIVIFRWYDDSWSQKESNCFKTFFWSQKSAKIGDFGHPESSNCPGEKKKKKKGKKGGKNADWEIRKKKVQQSAKCVNSTKGIKMYKKVQKKEKSAKKWIKWFKTMVKMLNSTKKCYISCLRNWDNFSK